MRTNRKRRIAEEDAERARLLEDRISSSEREGIRRRERSLLNRVEGVSVPDDGERRILLLSEDTTPLAVHERALHMVLSSLLGIELHPDVVDQIRSVRERGLFPCVTLIDGWSNVYGIRALPLCAGGNA